jgi:hypothetical protein
MWVWVYVGVVDTHVVDGITRVASESEEGVRTEGRRVAVDGLHGCHQNRRGQEADPFFVENGERLGAKVEDNARGDAEREEEG